MKKIIFAIISHLVVILNSCNPANVPDGDYMLTVDILPGESGTIQPSGGNFEEGTQIELEAIPAEGYIFVRWDGDLAGTDNPVVVSFDSDKSISAVFRAMEYPLTVNISGQGSVREELVNEAAKTDYEYGSDVRLTAEPADGWQFIRWEDGLNGEDNPVILRMNEEKSVTAVFEQQSDEVQVQPTHLVIMPLGDSITNDGRSRIKLWNLLTEEGHTIDYVGDQRQETLIPDPYHEGVGGITIEEVQEKAESLMIRHNPEFINLMIGTNNIAWYIREPVEVIAERWNELVQDLLDYSDPEAWLIAATIPPVTSRESGHDSLDETDRAVVTARFNEILREYVRDRQMAGDRIVLADMEAVMSLDEHVAEDGVHLNAAGYELMGEVYYDAIITILKDR